MLWFDSFVWFVARLPSGLTCMLLYLIIETWQEWRRMTWLDFASRDCLWLWELMSHNNEWQGTCCFCSSGESNVILCAFLLAVLILHGVVDVPAALESKLVTQLWSSIPPLHHRLHLNRSKAENGFTGAQIEKKWPRNKTRKGDQNISFSSSSPRWTSRHNHTRTWLVQRWSWCCRPFR